MRRIPRFLRLPRSAARVRADVDDEIRFDIDMRAHELTRRGVRADAARARAVAEFGDIEATRRYCEEIDMQIEADVRRSQLIDDARADLLVAWRAMRRAPAFAAVVLLTLALGIGANTAVFSVVRRVLIAPLPFRAPEQLFRLYAVPSTAGADDDKLSAAELSELAAESHSIAGLTVFGNYGGFTYTDGQTAEPWQTVSVAPNFFDVLGMKPVLGRAFMRGDGIRGGKLVLILSYAIWQRVFGGDRNVIGKTVLLNAIPFAVVGVLPETFVGPTFSADVLLPWDFDATAQNPVASQRRMWRSVVRLREGVSLEQFRSEIEVLRPRVQARNPEIKNAGTFRPVELHEAIVGRTGPVLIMVMIGALVVLVVACVNIAGLFLSRAVARRRELGVRAALGAGRGRLVRQVLTESLVYGAVGGIFGVALSVGLKDVLVAVAGSVLPQFGEVRIDMSVLVFALVLSIASSLVFGLLPALAATRVDVRTALGDGAARSASHGKAAARGSRTLVSAQIAFAVVFVVVAGLLTRTFVVLLRTNLGYTASEQQATFMLNIGGRFREPAARSAFATSLIERLHALPGVRAVGYTAVSPWNGGLMQVGFRVDGRAVDANAVPKIEFASASPEFFSAAGIPVRMGRAFNTNDRAGSPPVVVISESVARRFWPNENPVGARVHLDDALGDSTAVPEVVGVVADVRPSATDDIQSTVYMPADQAHVYGNEFVLRADGDARPLLPMIKQSVHELDARIPLINPRTMHDMLADSVRRQQLAMGLMGAFAILALVLAALGVYGIMAYGVAARRREFGIRSALGASRAAILWLVLRQGLLTAMLGVAAGVLGAAALSRFVGSMLSGVSTHDTMTFVAAPTLLAIVAIVACAVPARSATKVQPVEALRLE